MFARLTIIQVNINRMDEAIKSSIRRVLSPQPNHRKAIVGSSSSLIAKQAKAFLSPFGTVKGEPSLLVSSGRGLKLFVFRLPVLGDLVLKNHVARFCRTLGTLLQAQVSLVDALDVSQRISTNGEMKKEIGQILRHVKEGRAVAEPLTDSKLFPPLVAQMITVGEVTSELDSMLFRVADYYEKELDSKVESLSSIIEPVIILLLGCW